MTLSEFLENNHERTQLPSIDPLYNAFIESRTGMPSEDMIADGEPTVRSPSMGEVNISAILGILNDKAASRNFTMETLKHNTVVNPEAMLDSLSIINNEKPNPIAKAHLALLNSAETKAQKLYNKVSQDLSRSVHNEGEALHKDEQSNIKGTGLAVDGFSGGAYKPEKTNRGLIANLGTMAAGADVSETLGEAFRKVHLRNYYKYMETSALRPKIIGKAAADNTVRDLLNARLKGVSEEQAATGSFLTSYGLSQAEYKSLMTNDKIISSQGSIGSTSGSIYSTSTELSYGMVAKRDTLIDSGRFTKDLAGTAWADPKNQGISVPNTKGKVLFNISSFAADPAHMPFFREQMLSLGNEVTYANAFADFKYVSTNGFDIKIINNNSHANRHKRASWTFSNDKSRGDSTKTAVSMLAHRFPDFMGNMSYVFFTENVDQSLNSVTQDLINIEPARVTDINVKMPDMKIESIPYLSRTIPVLSNSIAMSHQGSIKIRMDENLSIWQKINAAAGMVLESHQTTGFDDMNKYRLNNNFDDVRKTNMFRNSSTQIVRITGKPILTNSTDLYVAYELITGFLPLDKPTDPSTPYAKDLINYQHDGTNNLYSRYFVFRDVRFLGSPEIELSKESDVTELSFNFTFKRIDEEEYGHNYDS